MADLKEAMRTGNHKRRDTIRFLRAGIHNAEVEQGKTLDDQGVIAVIAKQVKLRRESIAEFRKAGRQDLLDKEEAELAILQEYLPQQLTRDEIAAAASKVIAEVGAHGRGDIGKVMPRLTAELRGRADGRTIGEVVSELLAQG